MEVAKVNGHAGEMEANAALIASAPDMRAALDAKGARIAELETEALARSNAIRHAFATVRCAIERGERPGATADDVLRVLVTLDIPAALECVRDGSFVR